MAPCACGDRIELKPRRGIAVADTAILLFRKIMRVYIPGSGLCQKGQANAAAVRNVTIKAKKNALKDGSAGRAGPGSPSSL